MQPDDGERGRCRGRTLESESDPSTTILRQRSVPVDGPLGRVERGHPVTISRRVVRDKRLTSPRKVAPANLDRIDAEDAGRFGELALNCPRRLRRSETPERG